MSFPIASEKSPFVISPVGRLDLRSWPRPVAAPFKVLTALRANECRYCVQDRPEGEMQRALFCARPTSGGPYCPGHGRVCRRPNDLDIDHLAAELAATSHR
jgi:hypothetical protein